MKKQMKKTLLWLILSVSAWTHATTLDAKLSFSQDHKPTLQETQAAHMAADILA